MTCVQSLLFVHVSFRLMVYHEASSFVRRLLPFARLSGYDLCLYENIYAA